MSYSESKPITDAEKARAYRTADSRVRFLMSQKDVIESKISLWVNLDWDHPDTLRALSKTFPMKTFEAVTLPLLPQKQNVEGSWSRFPLQTGPSTSSSAPPLAAHWIGSTAYGQESTRRVYHSPSSGYSQPYHNVNWDPRNIDRLQQPFEFPNDAEDQTYGSYETGYRPYPIEGVDFPYSDVGFVVDEKEEPKQEKAKNKYRKKGANKKNKKVSFNLATDEEVFESGQNTETAVEAKMHSDRVDQAAPTDASPVVEIDADPYVSKDAENKETKMSSTIIPNAAEIDSHLSDAALAGAELDENVVSIGKDSAGAVYMANGCESSLEGYPKLPMTSPAELSPVQNLTAAVAPIVTEEEFPILSSSSASQAPKKSPAILSKPAEIEIVGNKWIQLGAVRHGQKTHKKNMYDRAPHVTNFTISDILVDSGILEKTKEVKKQKVMKVDAEELDQHRKTSVDEKSAIVQEVPVDQDSRMAQMSSISLESKLIVESPTQQSSPVDSTSSIAPSNYLNVDASEKPPNDSKHFDAQKSPISLKTSIEENTSINQEGQGDLKVGAVETPLDDSKLLVTQKSPIHMETSFEQKSSTDQEDQANLKSDAVETPLDDSKPLSVEKSPINLETSFEQNSSIDQEDRDDLKVDSTGKPLIDSKPLSVQKPLINSEGSYEKNSSVDQKTSVGQSDPIDQKNHVVTHETANRKTQQPSAGQESQLSQKSSLNQKLTSPIGHKNQYHQIVKVESEGTVDQKASYSTPTPRQIHLGRQKSPISRNDHGYRSTPQKTPNDSWTSSSDKGPSGPWTPQKKGEAAQKSSYTPQYQKKFVPTPPQPIRHNPPKPKEVDEDGFEIVTKGAKLVTVSKREEKFNEILIKKTITSPSLASSSSLSSPPSPKKNENKDDEKERKNVKLPNEKNAERQTGSAVSGNQRREMEKVDKKETVGGEEIEYGGKVSADSKSEKSKNKAERKSKNEAQEAKEKVKEKKMKEESSRCNKKPTVAEKMKKKETKTSEKPEVKDKNDDSAQSPEAVSDLTTSEKNNSVTDHEGGEHIKAKALVHVEKKEDETSNSAKLPQPSKAERKKNKKTSKKNTDDAVQNSEKPKVQEKNEDSVDTLEASGDLGNSDKINLVSGHEDGEDIKEKDPIDDTAKQEEKDLPEVEEEATKNQRQVKAPEADSTADKKFRLYKVEDNKVTYLEEMALEELDAGPSAAPENSQISLLGPPPPPPSPPPQEHPLDERRSDMEEMLERIRKALGVLPAPFYSCQIQAIQKRLEVFVKHLKTGKLKKDDPMAQFMVDLDEDQAAIEERKKMNGTFLLNRFEELENITSQTPVQKLYYVVYRTFLKYWEEFVLKPVVWLAQSYETKPIEEFYEDEKRFFATLFAKDHALKNFFRS